MQISTTIGHLKLALQCVLKAIDTKQITAEFSQGKLMIHACARQGHAKALVPTEGELPDMVFPVTGKLVLAIINSCDVSQTCTITQQADGLRLKFGNASIKLARYTEKEVEFLPWASAKEKTRLVGTLDAQQLRAALRSVAHFCSADSNRFQLCGVYFQSINNKLVLAATNGLRLAEKKSEMGVQEFPSMIIGGKYLEALVGIIKNGEDIAFSVVGTNQPLAAIFSSSSFSIKCPLVGGQYPDYRAIFPVSDLSVTVEAAALIAALERMDAVSDAQFSRLAFANGSVSVITTDGDSNEYIKGEGDDFQLNMGLQPQLLIGVIQSATTQRVQLSVTSSKGAESFLVVKNTENDGWLALMTPARI